jgi:peptidoglycan hydrolase-like protein with peptidoglycan-binding domain
MGDGGSADKPDEPGRELYAVVVQLPELRRGDTGYYVQEMQSQLVLHKCAPKNTIRRDGTCDGEFGTGTEAALRKFQAMRKLPTTGICDGQCWTELINK